jgi:hypothetical protein
VPKPHNGDFGQYEWEFDGDADWTITSSGAYEGTYAAKSGSIGDNADTELKLTREVAADDSIAFYVKVSSESGYDYLQFYINNQMQEQWAGEVAWTRVAFPVDAGEQTFRWVYEKDVYVSNGDDCGWIDFIELPAMSDETMSANAGADDEICEGMDYETNAYGQNYETLLWETSGTGYFDDATVMDAMYMPSQEDWDNGMITLSLTVYNGSDEMTDEMELSFMPMPEDAGTVAGIDLVCAGWSEIYMIDELEDTDWYHWVLMPEEAGVIEGMDHEVTIAWSEDFTGEAMLSVQGMNDCGEGVFADFPVMVDACTGIDESVATELFVSPNPSKGIFTLQSAISRGNIEIIDLTGKVVLQQRLNAQQSTIDASDLNEGIYFIKIQDKNSTAVEKLIIRK